MKYIVSTMGLLMAGIIMSGCAGETANPAHTTTNPTTGIITTNPAVPPTIYTAPPALTTITADAQQALPVITAVAASVPVTSPFAPLISPIVLGVIGLISTIYGGIITAKNNQNAAAAASMANTINNSGGASIAIASAPDPATAATIAQHLSANVTLPVSQPAKATPA